MFVRDPADESDRAGRAAFGEGVMRPQPHPTTTCPQCGTNMLHQRSAWYWRGDTVEYWCINGHRFAVRRKGAA